MATTYLTLVNLVRNHLNEEELASFSSLVGFDQFSIKAILQAARDVNNAELEWPFNYTSGSQLLTPGTQFYTLPSGYTSIDWESFTLIPTETVTNGTFASNITSWTDISTGTGSSAHTSDGNGRCRLAGGASGVGAVTQAITTIVGYKYKVVTRIFSGTVGLDIGTTSGGDEIAGYNLTISNEGSGPFSTVYFTATATTTYLSYSNSANANYDVDYVSCTRDISSRHLCLIDYDEWLSHYKGRETYTSHEAFGTPERVFFDQNGRFGLSPIPNEDHTATFDYWAAPTEMTTTSSNINIPDRFIDAVVERALFYCYRFRHHNDAMYTARDNFKDHIKRMRTELINKPQRMKAT